VKIVIDAANIDTGGAYRQLTAFVQYAEAAGHDVELYCACLSNYSSTLMGSAVRVSCPGLLQQVDALKKRPPSLINEIARLMLTLRWRESQLPRLVASAKADVLFNPNAILPTKNNRGCSYVVMSQNMLPFDKAARRLLPMLGGRIKVMLIRRRQIQSIGRANGVVFISEHAAQRIPPQIPNLRGAICVNYLGVDDAVFYPKEGGIPSGKKRQVLYVSHMQPYKHFDTVIAAFGVLCRHYGGDVELVIIGSDSNGAQARLTALANLAGVGDCVTFRGELTANEVAIAMREATVGLFASSCENCPTTLIEKMKSGLPIAASNMPPMTEILGEAGLYFDPKRPMEIAGALRRLLDTPALRTELKSVAILRAKRYNISRHNEKLLAFMGEVVGRERN
jgi:glycosyltransferase involved in cell wall biosynthesis